MTVLPIGGRCGSRVLRARREIAVEELWAQIYQEDHAEGKDCARDDCEREPAQELRSRFGEAQHVLGGIAIAVV